MRLIYVDEAGTSAKETVTVVVGIIVHADKQWAQTLKLIKEALTAVPEQHRKGFVFHATEVNGSHKYRDGWDRKDRLALLHRMMAIPSQVGLAIAYGAARRDATHMVLPDNNGRLSKEQIDHMFCFGICMGAADEFMKQRAGPSEVAVAVAEDLPEMRQFIRKTAVAFSKEPYVMESGRPPLGITRVVDTIHFVEKQSAPILQLADACAYGYRRSFTGLPLGAEFERSIVGPENPLDGPLTANSTAGVIFRFQKLPFGSLPGQSF